MRTWIAALFAGALALTVFACSQSESHPPTSDGCKGELCFPGSQPVPLPDAGAGEAAPADATVDTGIPDAPAD